MFKVENYNWANLEHAYGSAQDIPHLLLSLSECPPSSDYESEPYFSLWSSLCHQGDVYSASYAALICIVEILSEKYEKVNYNFFLLPISIEIARLKGNGPELGEFEQDYYSAIGKIAGLVAKIKTSDEVFSRVLAAATAVVHGNVKLGEAILELSPDTIDEFFEWLENR